MFEQLLDREHVEKNKKKSSLLCCCFHLMHQHEPHKELGRYWPAAIFCLDSVEILLASSLLMIFPLSLLLFVNPPPPPPPQTNQIELLKPSGPQSSAHKCQRDYQPNWHSVSPAFLSREAGWELSCSREVRTVIHTGPTSKPSGAVRRRQNVPLSSQDRILHT